MTKLREMKKASNENPNKLNPRLLALPIAGVIVAIALVALLTQPPAGLTTLPEETAEQGQSEEGPVIGEIRTFTDTGNEIELQDGKPVIRLFSTTGCPHCKWIGATYKKVVKEYVAAGKIVAYHWEIDIVDDTLTEAFEGSVPDGEMAVYRKFNPSGTVPTFVFGGRYSRVGNGYEGFDDTRFPNSEQSLQHLAQEEAEFRGVIEALLAEVGE